MSDTAPVHVMANFTVHDAETYRIYEKGFFPILKRHRGTFITLDDDSTTFEGSAPPEGRVVLFKFPNAEAATAWYNDPDYQALSEHRRAGTELKFLTMLHPMPGR
ncbi:DUF1330 domain-containing protein [Parasphingorhabdus cellanae]|uniref:DUF1330 domain-containing protein n=1 Tax=Parasphingorhabdus cellanae TaxID=2806553 RepID=A0ABX7T1B9_9SPHN|nr:DUF1330 domain-containing protein [Parasphingorhabdus cellanae]QTD54575.1 DUF1330 domain-containing protein [Parasphingorhabdus cellanae]